MRKKILLIEPNYKNKYPPIGLMKISTYHKMLGDDVTFYKGDLKEFIVDRVYAQCVNSLRRIDKSVSWHKERGLIRRFIKSKQSKILTRLQGIETRRQDAVERCLIGYADYYRKKQYQENPQYDRVYVTTLFTFYWQITVDTIHFAKKLVKKPDECLVGGVMASLLTDEIERETGIKPISGLLDKPGMLDNSRKAKSIIIDDLPLDYSILDEIEYEYPTQSAYFTFMTKGCTRKCTFCSVPKLEPTYKPKIETLDKFQQVKERFGEQKNLLLMDNNVLASPQFPEIIQEIKQMGFQKGATFMEPNQFRIAIRNLREGYNDKAYLRRSVKLVSSLASRMKNGPREELNNLLHK